jgi:DNA repair exonuclease SbcCD nuclease subunit
MLEKYFSKDKRVNFLVPTSYDAYYKIYNLNYLLTHGDRLGVRGGAGIVGMLGPIARGVQKVKAEYSNQKKPIDYVLMGHFHQYISLKDAIVNGSVKGYDEYALSGRFSYEKPQQALWFTHPTYGITFQVPVQSEPQISKKPTESWVSWGK